MIFIGLDIGSTAVKAVAVDGCGNILSRGRQTYPTGVSGSYSTQNPGDWWRAAVGALRQVTGALPDPAEVCAMGVSAQGGSIFALDHDFCPMTEAMTWMDRRAFAEAEEIIRALGDKIYKSCGWPTSPADCASKLLWLKRNQPEVFGRAAKFLTTGEYINYKLTGRAVADPTGAAITRLYDINKLCWNDDLLGFLGIGGEMLPEVLPCGSVVGRLAKSAARELGLGEHVVIFCGAHDQYCASLGSGVINPGDILLATGTAWVIFGVLESLRFVDRHIAPGIHPAGGRYGAMTSLGGIGAAIESHAARYGLSLQEIDRVAEARRGEAAELLICPLSTDRGLIDHRRTGSIDSRKYDEYDIALAMMEGAAFEVRLVLDKFRDLGVMPVSGGSLTMSGGAAKSRLWSSIVAAVCNCKLLLTEEPDTPALGAAVIAAVGSGAFSDYAACLDFFVRKKPLYPQPDLLSFYREKFGRYVSCFIR
jgi:sugar (pentulose or hexulose) kinase